MGSGMGQGREHRPRAGAWRAQPGVIGLRSDAYAWIICVFAFAIAWIALSAPWLSGHVTIPYDAKAHFQAQIQFLANALATGQSPFWNPHVFGGSPQIADPQSMIFSPALLLAWINPAPSFQAVDALVFGMLGLGGAAVILLFREKGWEPLGAMVAALGFAFGASAASRVQHIGQIFSLVFFMIALWLVVRMARRASLGSGVALGAAAGMMIVQPDQVALLGCYSLVIVLACEVAVSREPSARLRALLAPSAIAAAVATLIASGPILLAWLFIETTTRPAITYDYAVSSSLHPASLLTAVIGDLFGAQNSSVHYWGPFSATWQKDGWMLT